MGIYKNLKTFCGKKVVPFDHHVGLNKKNVAWRVSWHGMNDEEEIDWDGVWQAFVRDPKASAVEELVIGLWGYESVVFEESRGIPVQSLLTAKAKLPKLKALFLGEVTREECEVSWINQSDVSPLLKAFPLLETLYIRGANHLEFTKPVHDRLKTLVIQTGGLNRKTVKQIAKAKFPALEHLELWLGESQYGGDSEPKDLKPFLEGGLFPNLTYLGLCNSENADKIAKIVGDAPILEQLETLDLSKGNMTDAGAQALLDSPLVARLKKLDLSHHFISKDVQKKFKAQRIAADFSDTQEPYDENYTNDQGEVYRHIYASE